MAVGGVSVAVFGVPLGADRREDVATPLTATATDETNEVGSRPAPAAATAGTGGELPGAAARPLRARRPGPPAARLHRYRLGPGRTVRAVDACARAATRARRRTEPAREREIEMLARALEQHGPTERRVLAQRVGGRYSGARAAPAALCIAVDQGLAQRLSRHTSTARPDRGASPVEL